MRDTAVYDYSVLVDFNNVIKPVLQQITRGQITATEAFESIADKTQSYIDKHYNAYVNK